MQQTNNQANNDVIQALRTAHQNQTQLNLMADQKANILIGTLVLMYTVILTRMPALLATQSDWYWPIGMLILLQLIPLFLTAMVLIPKNIQSTKEANINDIKNPLFFGFFTRYSEQQYSDYMQQNLTNNTQARQLLMKDIYQIGLVLKRKYWLLRWAYLFALLGLVLPLLVTVLMVATK